ncbi:648_t:CDS:2 [Funneliformis geosporum]|nr:648_t:CDS:2 [Funneliformis geosporum]
MGFFVVCVLKEAKTIVSDKIVKPPEKWVYVEEGLQGDILMLFKLSFTHIKFVLEATGIIIQERPNAFDLIMEISQSSSLELSVAQLWVASEK